MQYILTLKKNYMSNILVTGSKGQLGSELKDFESEFKQYSFYFTDSDSLDITDHEKVKKYCIENEIEIIINCAAFTAVDKAESDVELCDAINHLAVRNFAEIARTHNSKLIQISTDYVFDGTNHRPYIEKDQPNPQSVYGKTKLDGEEAIKKINPENSIIIRTSWVYSSYGNNFVKTMLRLGKERDELGIIFDQVGTPTYAKDLAKYILDIVPQLKSKSVDVYHYSNEGVCSWYDFAKAIFQLSGISVNVKPIQTFQHPTPAQRPSYSCMNKSKIKEQFNIEVPYWKDSLKFCLGKLK
jgi:dTDP-4-dehydrorhamnose reductase